MKFPGTLIVDHIIMSFINYPRFTSFLNDLGGHFIKSDPMSRPRRLVSKVEHKQEIYFIAWQQKKIFRKNVYS